MFIYLLNHSVYFRTSDRFYCGDTFICISICSTNVFDVGCRLSNREKNDELLSKQIKTCIECREVKKSSYMLGVRVSLLLFHVFQMN